MAREDYLSPVAHSVTAVNIDGVLSLNCTWVLDLLFQPHHLRSPASFPRNYKENGAGHQGCFTPAKRSPTESPSWRSHLH